MEVRQLYAPSMFHQIARKSEIDVVLVFREIITNHHQRPGFGCRSLACLQCFYQVVHLCTKAVSTLLEGALLGVHVFRFT
jgi:hypothetical protein